MKRPLFLLITAVASFAFGIMMFFAPGFAADFLSIATTPQTISVLRGLGGLIIGSAVINFHLRNQHDAQVMGSLLLADIVTHVLGLSADIWGVLDNALTLQSMIPVELTHLFVAAGSLIYLIRLGKDLNEGQ